MLLGRQWFWKHDLVKTADDTSSNVNKKEPWPANGNVCMTSRHLHPRSLSGSRDYVVYEYKVSTDNEPHGKASRKIKTLAFRHCYHTTQSYFEKPRYLKIRHFSWPWACEFNQSLVVVDIISVIFGPLGSRRAEAVKSYGQKNLNKSTHLEPSRPKSLSDINNN